MFSIEESSKSAYKGKHKTLSVIFSATGKFFPEEDSSSL
jgi:hypothetical protein